MEGVMGALLHSDTMIWGLGNFSAEQWCYFLSQQTLLHDSIICSGCGPCMSRDFPKSIMKPQKYGAEWTNKKATEPRGYTRRQSGGYKLLMIRAKISAINLNCVIAVFIEMLEKNKNKSIHRTAKVSWSLGSEYCCCPMATTISVLKGPIFLVSTCHTLVSADIWVWLHVTVISNPKSGRFPGQWAMMRRVILCHDLTLIRHCRQYVVVWSLLAEKSAPVSRSTFSTVSFQFVHTFWHRLVYAYYWIVLWHCFHKCSSASPLLFTMMPSKLFVLFMGKGHQKSATRA